MVNQEQNRKAILLSCELREVERKANRGRRSQKSPPLALKWERKVWRPTEKKTAVPPKTALITDRYPELVEMAKYD